MSLHGRRATSDDAQQTKLSVSYATRRTATVPQSSKYQTSGANAKSVSRNRMSVGSSSSSGQNFANSGDDGSRSERETRQPSNLPRSTSSHSNARLDAIAASRPPPGSATAGRQKPDLQRPNIGAYETDHTTNMLRRKTPSIEQYMARDSQASNTRRTPLSSQSSHVGSGHGLETDTIFGVAFPDTRMPPRTNISTPAMYGRTRPAELPPSLIPELQALAASSDLSRSRGLPTAAVMSSPSSLYSDSPEPWSSRNTTPTSMSSYSPGIIQPLKLNPPVRRPNNTSSQQRDVKSRHGEPQWTETQKLPAVQEVAVPSSSGSANKNPVTPTANAEKVKRKKTPSPAPTPPPRKSSVKFKSSKAGEGEPDVGQETIDAEPTAAYQNPPDSPLRERNAGTVDYIGQSLEGSSYARTQNQDSLPVQPRLHPRRGETREAGLRAFPTIQKDSGHFSDRGRKLSGPKQPPVSCSPQQPDNTILVRPADRIGAQGAAYAPLVNTSRTPPTREKQAIAPNTATSTPSRSRRAPSTGPEDSDKETKSTPRSGLSKISTFFSRRARSEPPEATKDNISRSGRKGPAAGTGHEGYRKHAFRSRKMSSESTASSDSRSLSQGNIAPRPSTSRKDSGCSHRTSRNSKEDPAAEQFVAQRLEPVVILGGGGYRNRPERDAPTPWPTYDGGLALNRSGYEVQVQQASESLSAQVNRNAAFVQQPANRDDAVLSRTQGADMSLTMQITTEPSLAARRSFTRAQVYGDTDNTVRIPTPIKTEGLAIVPAPASYTTSQSSLPYSSNTLPQVENEMHKVDAKHLKKPSKKGRSLKWNFFQRGQNSDKGNKISKPEARTVMEVPVTITYNPNPRSVPYYAVMDSETDIDHSETLGDFLAQAVDSPSLAQIRNSDPHIPEPQRPHGNSVLLPSLPPLRTDFDGQARPASPKVQLYYEEARTQEDAQSSSNARPRRLAQVGRIPRVISRKDYHHVPPVESYSRPFSRGRIEPAAALGVSTAGMETERPLLGIQTDILPSRPFKEYDSGKPASAPARTLTLQDHRGARPEQEFLTFTSRHGSEVSISSDSEGIISIAAPHHLFPVHHHGEEEVWNEYNELIDRILPPAEERKAQSLGGSSRTATNRALGGRRKAQPRKEIGIRTDAGPTATPPVVEPITWQASARGSGGSSEDIRLRGSRIVSALHSSFSPTSPFSLADLVAEYEERNRISAQLPRRTSDAIKAETAYLSPLTYGGTTDFPSLVQNHHQSTLLLDVAERDHEGPAAQSELHFAALMTSKWLSFGRVLFSPAHQEVETLPQQQVLVIDGLRNSDWSFYCALTYPSATIHDLRESDLPPNFQQSASTESGGAPPNYRRVEQSSLAERFPFPTSFFTVVVLRFPPAMSDAILKLMISECKRVLMPGGHLEFMVMDIDMVNMGPHTRRAVKDLKVRMTQADPDVSLKPASDNIQNVLGRKGFEGLNRCIVGIPVAGKVAGSMDSSSSSRSSNGSYTQTATDSASAAAAGARAGYTKRHHEHNTNFSLSDLIADHSPTSDERITKMVAKVGRYWFLRSFEAAVLPDGDLKKSIWADKQVLHECKNRGSGFKLLIAYAQKPVENRRRTVSEPSLPTLATAGTPAMKRTR
jgi:hypothetical protein